MDVDALKSLSLHDLKLVAAKHGIQVHHRAGQDAVLKAIVDHVTTQARINAIKAGETKDTVVNIVKDPLRIMTHDEVRDVLKRHVSRDEFVLRFCDDDTMIMSCNGAEESIHLSSPAAVIKRRADIIARGAYRPRMINIDGENIMSA